MKGLKMSEDISFLVIQLQAELNQMKLMIAGQLDEYKISKLHESIAVLKDIIADMEDVL